MGFSPHRTEIRQYKIQPRVFSEQTAKYNVHQYFCLYGTINLPCMDMHAMLDMAVDVCHAESSHDTWELFASSTCLHV